MPHHFDKATAQASDQAKSDGVGSVDLAKRVLLKGAATGVLLAAARALLPSGAHGQTSGPEIKGFKLGYIALTDAAPLIIAKEKGMFDKYGIPDTEVAKQASWGALRDNIVLGSDHNGIDGAHILSPMPYLLTTGKITQNNVPVPMAILARLDLNCQGISISNEYKELAVQSQANALKEAFAKKKADGKEVKCAMTFPGGTHDLWLRYWLAAGGIDPEKDVSVIVVPPPQMVANMKVGSIDAFCVGEPWNEQLVNQDIGYTATSTGEIWLNHPEKALGVRADMVEKNPKATQALLMAVLEAQQWCEKLENKQEMAEIIGRRQWFNVPVADIIGRIKGEFNYGLGRKVTNPKLAMRFFGDGASYPYKSHDLWFLTENMRWGKFDVGLDTKALVNQVNREDLWREAVKALSVPASDIPTTSSRGKETFFDGKVFDPEDPMAYLKSLAIKRVG